VVTLWLHCGGQCAEGPTLIRLSTGRREGQASSHDAHATTLSGGYLLLYDGYRTDCALLWGDALWGGATAGGGLQTDGRVDGQTDDRTEPAEACAPRSGLRVTTLAAEGLEAIVRPESPQCVYMGAGGFGALHSADLRTWRDVSASVNIPRHHKHGTALQLTWPSLCAICRAAAAPAGSAVEDVAAQAMSAEVSRHWGALGVLKHCTAHHSSMCE